MTRAFDATPGGRVVRDGLRLNLGAKPADGTLAYVKRVETHRTPVVELLLSAALDQRTAVRRRCSALLELLVDLALRLGPVLRLEARRKVALLGFVVSGFLDHRCALLRCDFGASPDSRSLVRGQ